MVPIRSTDVMQLGNRTECRNVSHCQNIPIQDYTQPFRSKLPTYPSLKLTLTLTSHLGQNDGVGEG